jgi:arsenate reductase
MIGAKGITNVLFLCTGNSARSILAESCLNARGQGRFRAFSAGSHPAGRVNPHAIALLSAANLPVAGLRSKSWDEFALPGAPQMDLIITVCDNAAGEVCPIWPGHPASAHWPFEDPAAFVGPQDAITRKFLDIFMQIRARIDALVNLSPAMLEELVLKGRLGDLGRAEAGIA